MADAPLDGDVFAFADHAAKLLPGRLRLVRLALDRNGDATALTASGIHAQIDFEWLSNGAPKTLEGGL